MKKITKKRLAEQRAALGIVLEAELPDEITKQINDIRSLLEELDSVLEPENKFKAAAELMVAVGLLNAKQAKQGLESARLYDN